KVKAMKHLFVVTIAFLLTTGCSKNNFTLGEGDPGEFHMHFEFLKGNDSSYFKEGDIQLSDMVKAVNLKTDEHSTYEDFNFHNLKVDSAASDLANKRLFGPYVFAMGWEKEEEAGGHGNELFFDRYFLLRYKGTEMDTLCVRDSTKVGFYRYFRFFINGERLEVSGQEDDNWSQSGFYFVQVQTESPSR